MDLTKYGISNDNKILSVALTHTSYANEHNTTSYERLEYLGDAILELVISEYFYKNTNLSEGDMSKQRSMYVCEEALYEYSKKINLSNYIKVGNGIDKVNATITADVFEALIATIYLNSGLNKAKEFIYDYIVPSIKNKDVFLSDYKSYLQELVQTDQRNITYRVINETGPAHDKTFEVEVIIDNMVYGTGIGKNKKEAEQLAAKDAINKASGGIK